MKQTSGCGKEVKQHVEHIVKRIMKQIVKHSTKVVGNKMKNDSGSTCHICCKWRIVTCAANASSLLVTRFLIFLATNGNFVFSKVVSIATGALPFISLNEV
jgi:hypothetical protein